MLKEHNLPSFAATPVYHTESGSVPRMVFSGVDELAYLRMRSSCRCDDINFQARATSRKSQLFRLALSLSLVDSKGTSIYFLSPQQELPVIAAHAAFWQWQSLLQLGGSVVATAGLVLLTLLLWTAGNRVWSVLGIMAFLLSEVLWLVIEAFRLGTSVWVTLATTASTTAPEFYDLLFRWLEGSLFAIAISLALGGLAAYGGAFLTTRGLARWVGWVMVVYACLGLGVVIFAGAALIPPEFVYLALLFLGVVLWFRHVPTDLREQGGSRDVAAPGA